MEKEDSFPQRVWQIVAAIPEGYVTTYGDVAKLAGSPRACASRRCVKASPRRQHLAMAPGG